MAARRSIDFLPGVFRTTANKKFLNATLDQLIQEPEFKKINGYIGRAFAPTNKTSDVYVQEPTQNRKNYQLEPGLVVVNKQNTVEFFSSYIDVLDKIKHYGGTVTDHSRLFASEYYSFSGVVDFDKLVNFNQYYWIPTGPAAVNVTSGGVPLEENYVVEHADGVNAYRFDITENEINPTIILSRGGSYTFEVDQGISRFWIQTELGTAGTVSTSPNLSSRDIYGVENNGTNNGIITFNVPMVTQQDFYIKMPRVAVVDYATDLTYTEIANQWLSKFIDKKNGLDGKTLDLHNKTFVFTRYITDDEAWSAAGIFDRAALDSEGLEYGDKISSDDQRYGLWKILLEPIDAQATDYIIRVVSAGSIPNNHKVTIKSGQVYANTEFFKNSLGTLQRVPSITAPLNTLYYQDSKNSKMYGKIVLVDPYDTTLNVDQDIIGQKNYTSPNGIKFTNGLKIKFDSTITPSNYAKKTYYVEGVGKGIKLVDVNLLVAPELNLKTYSVPYDSTNYDIGLYDESTGDPIIPDYIMSNRASQDLNPWARQNRWFHEDVIRKTAEYNGSVPLLDQSLRAKRPIIEFNPSVQMQNFASRSKRPVDLIDFTITNAFSQIENSTVSFNLGLALVTGVRIIFANDQDPLVKNKIYRVNVVKINGESRIHLELADDSEVGIGDGVVVMQGADRGNCFWFNGTQWNFSQQKTKINQVPLFDIVDNTGTSVSALPGSNFAGCQLFSYKTGTGKIDDVLGFSLGYRNSSFNSIGDIEFVNNFETDNFTTTTGTLRTGNFFIRENNGSAFQLKNTWSAVNEPSKQYQILSYSFDGTTNYFDLDVAPAEKTVTANLKVYVNNKRIKEEYFQYTRVNARPVIVISADQLANGDKIDIKVYSKQASKIGYYEVPVNLDYNALNQQFATLTLGQLRNHLNVVADNNIDVVGQQPGYNNIRDLDISAYPGTILQHSAPVIYGSLFLLDNHLNFVDAVTLAQKEYTRFKNKFLELAARLPNLPLNDAPAAVDQIMQVINQVKTDQFPWYYSDMVPAAASKNVLSYQVYDELKKEYEITSIFNDKTPSRQAILVYHQAGEYTLQGIVQTKKNLLTQVNPTVFENIRVGQYITGTNVPAGTYITGVNNTEHQLTSTITLSADLITTGTVTIKTQPQNLQLVKDIDYTFDDNSPNVKIHFPLNYGDKITIVEYSNTSGNYVPETPTKLGLYPKFKPEIIFDNTYQTPTYVIQGHDGSITPAFGDYRDQYLLEFERRIFNNIKQDHAVRADELYKRLPGKFRNAPYTLNEFDKILTRSFLNWAGNNRIDFSKNDNYQPNNPFTWNYKKFNDIISNEPLVGHWRGIFKYYFDTDRPHTHPWEMFGFGQEPDWWAGRYGPTPVTSENYQLWKDVKDGYIAHGARQGYYNIFARPEIEQIIPVDQFGNLRSPEKFAVISFNSENAGGAWAIGDHGPVETAWRRSSEYAFALQVALALTNPGYYFAVLINTSKYQYNQQLNQYMLGTTNQKIIPSLIPVNGPTACETGYLNWVVDFLTNNGFDAQQKVKEYFSNLNVQLVYKSAGFVDKKYLTVLAEQSSPASINESIILPNENYKIQLTKSAPTSKVVYSAVIVEKTDAGYKIQGYDLNNPYFTIIPSLVDNQFYTIESLGQTGVIYENFQSLKLSIPYGTEFSSRQQLVDFLISYQRFLNSQGFVFDTYNTDLAITQDWVLSSKEFLTWSTQNWSTGSVLILSPAFDRVKLLATRGNVDEIKIGTAGPRILDLEFKVVTPNSFVCLRIDNEFELTLSNNVAIGLVELHLVEYEHSIIFDNETVFNDVIYRSELGNRQFRLKLVGNKTANWNGTLNPTGFIYNDPTVAAWRAGSDYRKNDLVEYKKRYFVAIDNLPAADEFNFSKWQEIDTATIKTGLLPNFANNATRLRAINDIDEIALDSAMEQYSTGIIGFRPRDYLTDLSISKTSQAKFYQGFIKEKGTVTSIGALGAGQFADLQSNISLNEEWAVRVGEYGALQARKQIEIILDEQKIKNNPTTLRLSPQYNDENLPGVVDVHLEDFYSKFELNYLPFANRTHNTNTESDILTAGYVNLADVDFAIFDITQYQDLSDLMMDIGTGFKIWTARDFNGSWNVYRVSETDITVVQIAYLLDQTIRITTDQPHNLLANQLFAIKNVGYGFDGFYRVAAIIDNNSVAVLFAGNLTGLQEAAAIDTAGLLFTLNSVRFAQATDLLDYVPPRGWRDTDKIWVDNDSQPGQWAVFSKNTPWANTDELPLTANDCAENAELGMAVKLVTWQDKNYAITGRPKINNGKITIFQKQSAEYTRYQDIAFYGTASNFGQVIESSNDNVYVAAPTWESFGAVAIYQWIDQQLKLTNIISSPVTGPALFGYSITSSQSGHQLYIGAPGVNQVFAFSKKTEDYAELAMEITYQTTYIVTALSNIRLVYNQYNFYRLGVDFTFENNQLTFTNLSVVPGTYTMVQSSDYVLTKTFSESDSVRYGHSIKTTSDGLQLVVGDPGYNNYANGVEYTGAGKFYVYDKVVEAFKATGSMFQLETVRAVNQNSVVVKVDDKVLNQNKEYRVISSNLITLTKLPAIYSTVRVETDEYLKILEKTMTNFGAALGFSTDICSYNCTVFVSAPQFDTQEYHSGLVDRYVNAGRVYGRVQGTVKSPTVNVGDSIRINDFELTFTDTSLESVVDLINAAELPGVTATIRDNSIEISSNSRINADKLRILPGRGTALADLGLDVFVKTQTILHPGTEDNENFGIKVKVDPSDVNNLLITSRNASTAIDTLFDQNQTYFDVASTSFVDLRTSTSTVYVLQLMTNPVGKIDIPSQYVHVQQLEASTLKFGDRFGDDLDINNGEIIAGAPGDDTINNNGGKVYIFVNSNKKLSWEKIRQWENKVDTSLIDGIFIYDRITKEIVQRLDFIDPAKGKILGQAQENIDFITEYDPARYNQGNNLAASIDSGFFWADKEIGKIWWDVSSVRYVDYEQGDLSYRSASWATTFPGSVITVCEWVKSTVPPSQYPSSIDNGSPKYADNSAYVAVQAVDSVTQMTKTYYYYWVVGKATIGNQDVKTLSTQAIAQYIASPQSQSIPYAAICRDNAITVYNIKQDLVARNRVLHVKYSLTPNTGLLHSEYALIKQNSVNSAIPQKILNKLLDSLIGIDARGKLVPDPQLNEGEKIGLGLRPRQTLFVNRQKAVENFISFVNRNLKTIPALVTGNVDLLHEQELLPAATEDISNELYYDQKLNSIDELEYLDVSTLPTGYRVLVTIDSDSNNRWAIYQLLENKSFNKIRVQLIKTTDFWHAVDWYATGYDPTAKTNYTVDLVKDIQKLKLSVGDTVRVENNGHGQFVIYWVNQNLKLVVVGIENGTLQINSTLYSSTNQPNKEFRNIFESLQQDIFVGEQKLMFNQLFFSLVNYVLSEQIFVDWVFKTSFISVFHQLKKLEQFPNYIKDNQNYYEDYIKEVKPYRTKIREYAIDYVKQDLVNSYTTDFDLPAYWSEEFQTFRSPNGEKPSDVLLLDLPQYRAWRDHHDLQVESIDIETHGKGYTVEPVITIVGGGGTGATARAFIDTDQGSIERIDILTPGSGYTSQPQVIINGNGQGASAYAKLVNNKIRRFDTTLKFDRTSYTSKVVEWEKQTNYTSGTIVSYQGRAYRVTQNLNSGNRFNLSSYELIPAADLENAMDRTQAYYSPTVGMTPKKLDQLFTGLKYAGTKVEGWTFKQQSASERGFDQDPFAQGGFDAGVFNLVNGEVELSPMVDSAIQSYFADSLLGTRAEDINITGGKFVDTWSSHAPEELVPGMIYDHLNIQVFTKTSLEQNAPILGYRIVKDMLNNRSYYRIAMKNTTELAQDLNITDTEIMVTNVAALPQPNPARAKPGVIYINGERIIYYQVDRVRGALQQIRRAASGTGAAQTHLAGSRVVDSCETQEIKNANNKVWFNPGAGTVTDGTGLAGSYAAPAMFLKQSPSFLP